MNANIDTNSALEGLNEAQRYAVSLGDGPILVIAGAGTGKTRTLVHRVAYLVEKGVTPGSILLLTFTRRAAAEMLMRARKLNPACAQVEGGTFHSVAHRLLRRYGIRLGLPNNFTIIDPADAQQILKGTLEELGLNKSRDRRFPKARNLVNIISKARNLEMDLTDAIEEFFAHWWEYAEAIQAAAHAFAEVKKNQSLVDYDDLLFKTEELLAADAGLRRELGRKWRYLLVDEYQDTNAVQARLLELLSTEHQNIMAVGDDAQSIYAFRGARVKNILEFPKKFADTRLVKLQQNYRSTQNILDLTNEVIAHAEEGFQKNLFTDKGGGATPVLLRPREQRAQSSLVVERIRKLLGQGASPEDICVLFRAGRDSFDLEAALRAAHLPFVKYGGIRFVELAHVKDVMAHLRIVENPQDFVSWQRILMLLPKVGPKTAQQIIAQLLKAKSPAEYIPRLQNVPQAGRIKEIGPLAKMLLELNEPGQPPVELLQKAIAYYEPICREAYEDHPRRLRDLAELPALASQSESLADFLADTVLDPPEAQGPNHQGQPLTLSTVHSAKGKEWLHVFVIWLTDGRLPAFPSLEDPKALAEERRLFYVASTRAAQSLTLLAPKEHFQEGSGLKPVELSRYVKDLPESLLEQPAAGPVFPVAASAPPATRGSMNQKRPFAVGRTVSHAAFGPGRVVGYKGEDKIMVSFNKGGLKTLMIRLANLEPM